MSGKRKPTASDLIQLLRARYRPPEWAFLPSVRNQTGFLTRKRVRTADAIAFNLWPSRGLEIHGFEIKVDRADWLRELKDPAKADELAGLCHRWWAVAPPNLIAIHELPPPWGLLVAQKNRVIAKVGAPLREPDPLTREFVAAALRSATEQPKPGEQELKEQFFEGRLAGVKEKHADFEKLQGKHDDLQEAVGAFRERSGVDLNWEGPEVGDAVKALMTRRGQAKHRIGGAIATLEQALEGLTDARKQIEDLEALGNGGRK
jgi:hypothetical protein